MPLIQCLTALREDGRLRVPLWGLAAEPLAANDGVDDELRSLAERAAWELPGVTPPLSLPAARWGAERLLVACQALVDRALPPEQVASRLQVPCPVGPDASSVWSTDLTLRHLPRLLELGAGLAPDDPLTRGLFDLARAWPLSSVGVAVEPDAAGLTATLGDPGLRRLYVDRVLVRGARDRLRDPRVRDAARAALGAQRQLCPALADDLEESPHADRP